MHDSKHKFYAQQCLVMDLRFNLGTKENKVFLQHPKMEETSGLYTLMPFSDTPFEKVYHSHINPYNYIANRTKAVVFSLEISL